MGAKRTTIVFQGDSITDAGRSRDGGDLGGGYVAAVARSIGGMPGDGGSAVLNRGIGGNRVSDLAARWEEDTLTFRPDVISVLIGVNDVWQAVDASSAGSAAAFEQVYDRLLETTRAALPDTRLALCEPFLLPAGGALERWGERKALLAEYSQAVHVVAKKYGAVFVALQSAFEGAAQEMSAEAWLWDGVHPTAAGHDLIAREWLNAVTI